MKTRKICRRSYRASRSTGIEIRREQLERGNRAYVNVKHDSRYSLYPTDRSVVAAVAARGRFAARAKGAPIRVLVAWRANSALGIVPPTCSAAPDIRWLTPPVTEPKHLLSAIKRQRPDVLLLAQDIFEGLDASELRELSTRFAALRILLIAPRPTSELYAQVLRCRFHGVLPSNCPPETCPTAVRAIHQGEIWLSRAVLSDVVTQAMNAGDFGDARPEPLALGPKPLDPLSRRECEIAEFVQKGLTNKEIASKLDIREDTVKKHMQNIFRKLGVRRRTLVALNRLSQPPKTT